MIGYYYVCSDWSDLLRAFSISMVTRTDKAIVIGCRLSKTSQSTPLNSGLSAEHLLK